MQETISTKFDEPIGELLKEIEHLKSLRGIKRDSALERQIHALEGQVRRLQKLIFGRLTPWERVLLARHPNRPYTRDFIKYIFTDFIELHGDRLGADDKAIVTGIGKIEEQTFFVIGHQKGRDSKERMKTNFGMCKPAGYRKAIRVMKLAEKYRAPLLTIIDTPGADPTLKAEQHGQAWAIAESLATMSTLKTPIISIVTGEGGSGGAIALALADALLMLQYAVFSVISPEGCAAIIYRDAAEAPRAAESLKLTAPDLKQLGIIDQVVPEPLGGAHHNHRDTALIVKQIVLEYFERFRTLDIEQLLQDRYNKFRRIGVFDRG